MSNDMLMKVYRCKQSTKNKEQQSKKLYRVWETTGEQKKL